MPQNEEEQVKGKTIRIGKGRFSGRDNAVIQKAMDELAAQGGGTVELPAGIFEMADGLHLRSRVSVVGQGGETVLRKAAPSVSSPVADYVGYGHYEITLRDPDLFRPGMGVLIYDKNAFGFYTTQATLLARDGNAFFMDAMLSHDYSPSTGGTVVSIFPLVRAHGVRNAAVSHVTLDGANDPVKMNGCRGGGVFLLQCHGMTIEAVEVTNYNGDAVSFQQCTDVLVRGCHLHHNSGTGLHPGSGSVRYVMADNHIHDNGGDGVFYCLRTTHSLCEGNSISNNAGVGISIGERDTDHVIRGNSLAGNGRPAVLFRDVAARGGDRVVLEGNRFKGNCAKTGDAEVVIASGINSVVLEGNTFESAAPVTIVIGAAARDVCIGHNTVSARPLSPKDARDLSGRVLFGRRVPPLQVGPGAATAMDTRHLAVKLPRRPRNFHLPK